MAGFHLGIGGGLCLGGWGRGGGGFRRGGARWAILHSVLLCGSVVRVALF